MPAQSPDLAECRTVGRPLLQEFLLLPSSITDFDGSKGGLVITMPRLYFFGCKLGPLKFHLCVDRRITPKNRSADGIARQTAMGFMVSGQKLQFQEVVHVPSVLVTLKGHAAVGKRPAGQKLGIAA